MAMMASGTSGNPDLLEDHAVLDEDFLNDGMSRIRTEMSRLIC